MYENIKKYLSKYLIRKIIQQNSPESLRQLGVCCVWNFLLLIKLNETLRRQKFFIKTHKKKIQKTQLIVIRMKGNEDFPLDYIIFDSLFFSLALVVSNEFLYDVALNTTACLRKKCIIKNTLGRGKFFLLNASQENFLLLSLSQWIFKQVEICDFFLSIWHC